MNAHDFRRLLIKHINKDKGAFEKIYNFCSRKLISSAFLYLQDKDEALSVADDILVKLYNEPEKYLEIKSPADWLFISARNGALNILRKKNLQRRKETIINFELPYNPIGEREEIFDYYEILRQFARREQKLIVLKVDYGLSYREIANREGITISQVKYAFKNIKTRMKRVLEVRK